MNLKNTVLGIELGSTRIKAVLLDDRHQPIASGSHEWQSRFADGIWYYTLEDVRHGLQACYAELAQSAREKLGQPLTTVGAIGISGMMHGYLPFDRNGEQLTEFRCWTNTITREASEALTELFHFNIPQRWSIAHLYQAMLNGEAHIPRLAFMTTLAGYVHWQLTGEKVVGLGEASGMFPIDNTAGGYDAEMISRFDALIAERGLDWRLRDVLPQIRPCGAFAGTLTPEGARLLDPSGILEPGIPLVPPEGDASTGMIATNCVRVYTGNVSAGTSIYAMLLLDHRPGFNENIAVLTTPNNLPAALIQCNNCTSDINAWTNLFSEVLALAGAEISKSELMTRLFQKSLEADLDCGGLLSYNYITGESLTGLNEGRPMFARMPDSRFSLANFMRTLQSSALATLKVGIDNLKRAEGFHIEKLYAYGGFFKTPEVGQRLLSAAMCVPVSVMHSAGEGGPYGMAVLAAYALWRRGDEKLEDYLDERVFAGAQSATLTASPEEIESFAEYVEHHRRAMPVEREAVKEMRW